MFLFCTGVLHVYVTHIYAVSLLFYTPYILYTYNSIFFGGRGLNHRPCIYNALSIPTELSSRGLVNHILAYSNIFRVNASNFLNS